MLNEIKNFRSRHSWITWGLTIVAIVLTLQTLSADAEKPKTLDVIPIGGSDEFYEREYRPPPRNYPPPRPRPLPPPPPRPIITDDRPKPSLKQYSKDYSEEYYRRGGNKPDPRRAKPLPKPIGEHEVLWR